MVGSPIKRARREGKELTPEQMTKVRPNNRSTPASEARRRFNNKFYAKADPSSPRATLSGGGSSPENAFKGGYRPTSELPTSPFHPLAQPWPEAKLMDVTEEVALVVAKSDPGVGFHIRKRCGHWITAEAPSTECRLGCEEAGR